MVVDFEGNDRVPVFSYEKLFENVPPLAERVDVASVERVFVLVPAPALCVMLTRQIIIKVTSRNAWVVRGMCMLGEATGRREQRQAKNISLQQTYRSKALNTKTHDTNIADGISQVMVKS
jgi:hypothetical protein